MIFAWALPTSSAWRSRWKRCHLPKKAVAEAGARTMGDGPRIPRKRIEVVAHAVFRRRHPREHAAARNGTEMDAE